MVGQSQPRYERPVALSAQRETHWPPTHEKPSAASQAGAVSQPDPSARQRCGVLAAVGSQRVRPGAHARQPMPTTQVGVAPAHSTRSVASPPGEQR